MKSIPWSRVFTAPVLSLAMTLIMIQDSSAAQSPQIPLAGSAIPRFVSPLPTLSAAGGTMTTVMGNAHLTIKMCEFPAAVLPAGTIAPGVQPLTWVWGYLVDSDPLGLTPCASLVNTYKNSATGAVDTYIGPVVVNQRGSPTEVTWVNDLGSASSTSVLAYKYSTDQTLHWADPLADQTMANECMMKVETCQFQDPNTGQPQCFPPPGDACAENYGGPVAAAPHLHGGEVPAEIDGSPDSWFTSDGLHHGHKYYSFAGAFGNEAIYRYPNTQEAAPIWFHDHTLGATRLNVYAGLAGAYFIYDPALNLPANLQPLTEVVPIVFQDRTFDTDGQLFLPSDSAGGMLSALNPEHPYWVPEFVGDTIVINGKAWPFLNVQAKRYRFLFLNGSNARTYEMFLVNPVTKAMGPPLWIIGTDGGYLDTPVKIDPNAAKPAQTRLVMQPGERYEVIIDFKGFAGQNLVLKNTGRTPYPKGAPPAGNTLGQMMQFRVSAVTASDSSYDPASGIPLRTGSQAIARMVDPAKGTLATGLSVSKTRILTLNEVMGMPVNATDPVTGAMTAYPGGPLEILVNNTKWAGVEHGALPRADFTPVTVNGVTTYLSELPREGDTEVWEIVNTTADAHPIHLHLVQFQLINRQNYNANNYLKTYGAAFGTDSSLPALPAACMTGTFCPAYGPPLNYNPSVATGGKFGGNPDVAPFLQGPVAPPLPCEAGWKDTIITYPGSVTRIAVRYAPNDLPIGTPLAELHFPFDPGGGGEYNYVWHCHIIDHEDNEMMRPDMVQSMPSVGRTVVRGVDY